MLDSSLILRKNRKNETQVTATTSDDTVGNNLSEEHEPPNQHLKLAMEEIREDEEMQYSLITELGNRAASHSAGLLLAAPALLLLLLRR